MSLLTNFASFQADGQHLLLGEGRRGGEGGGGGSSVALKSEQLLVEADEQGLPRKVEAEVGLLANVFIHALFGTHPDLYKPQLFK